MCLLFGSLFLKAQSAPPCADFNDVNAGVGNFAPVPVGGVNYQISGSLDLNTFDNTRFLRLSDKENASDFVNSVDYKNLGKRFLGQCLYFDYYVEDDAGGPDGMLSGTPVHPYITLRAGSKSITFIGTANLTTGSGWVRVQAPIAHSNGTSLPSNAYGTWIMSPGMTLADFNDVIDNSEALVLSPEINSTWNEIVGFDNICIKECNPCNTFKLATTLNSSDNSLTAEVSVDNPHANSTYRVDWGDNTGTVSVYQSHTYSTPGTYNVCLIEYDDRSKIVCRSCTTICFSNVTNTPSQQGGSGSGTEPHPGDNNPGQPTGDAKISANKNFIIVPNPAKDYVEIQANIVEKGLISIKISDMMGKTVLESTKTYDRGLHKVRFSLENLLQGTYNVEIKNNNTINNQRLLISK